MLDDLAPAGLVGLQTTDIGQRNFLSVAKPVKTIADFAGLKTRIVPVPLHKEIWEAVGTAPVGLPYGEVYSALQTKVIDAVEINVSSVVGENLWEVGKYFTLTGHYPWHNLIVANKAFFDGLPPDMQAAMRQAGRESIRPTMDYTKNQDFAARDDLKKKGVQFAPLEDLPAMRAKMEPILGEWAKKVAADRRIRRGGAGDVLIARPRPPRRRAQLSYSCRRAGEIARMQTNEAPPCRWTALSWCGTETPCGFSPARPCWRLSSS